MKLLNNMFEQLSFNPDNYVNVSLQNNNEAFGKHWHNEAEIMLPLEGNLNINVNMTPYSLNMNDILLLYPGELHELEKSDNNQIMIVQFPFALINDLNDIKPSVPILRSVKLITKDKDSDIHEEIVSYLLNIRDEFLNGNEFVCASMYAYLIQIFILVAKKYTKLSTMFPNTNADKGREYIIKFTKVLDLINENYVSDITLESIADFAGYSKFHFSRLFRQFTNMSFNDYVNNVRISKAESLLISGNHSITEVASLSGFNSLSTFNRNFKLAKKCSPKDFKNFYRI